MPIDILMPAVHPGMVHGRVARWLVGEGQTIAPGHAIAEIESGGDSVEVTAEEAGRIVRILVPQGDAPVLVDAPIAVLLAGSEGGGADRLAAVRTADGRLRASPMARRLAAEYGLALEAVEGSGPQGRILKRDIEGAARSGAAREAAAGTAAGRTGAARDFGLGSRRGGFADWTKPASLATLSADERVLSQYPKGSYDLVPHDRLRRHVADRAKEAQMAVPQQMVAIDMRADALVALRDKLNARSPGRSGTGSGGGLVRISITDLLVKALALAFRQVPSANAAWTELGMLRHKSSDIAVAIALDGGVVAPVIRQAEGKRLAEISAELRSLRERAEIGRLTLEETRGGSGTVSNLGMLGVTRCAGLVNPPQASILAVGAIAERPVIGARGRIEAATLMACALSCDQRVIDGALAAHLLTALRTLVEQPERLLD